MKKVLKKLFDAVAFPFIALAVHIDESRRTNEDGSWDSCIYRQNKKSALRREKECRR